MNHSMEEIISISKDLHRTLIQNHIIEEVLKDFVDYTKKRINFTNSSSVVWNVNDYFSRETNVPVGKKVTVALLLCQKGVIIFGQKKYSGNMPMANALHLLADINAKQKIKLDLDAITKDCQFIFELIAPGESDKAQMEKLIKKLNEI